jgi:hypothetical protein
VTDQEFYSQALQILQSELGPDGFARFLRWNRAGTGDSTREREAWQKELTLHQILASIRERRAQHE